jgi:ceramide glucosyltransferase
MFVEAGLIVWSAVGLVWWLVAWWLVLFLAKEKGEDTGDAPGPFLTLFKPLPPLVSGEFREARGLESFLEQMDTRSEMVLGIHEADRSRVEPFLTAMRAQYPQARIEVVWRDEPDSVANPKIAWLQILAPHARGELWLWSDADIVAPPGFLRAAREEYAAAGARLLTWPYIVREIAPGPAVLDALFVNVEFFPGVLLLRRLGPVDFGLGAAMLFLRKDFEERVTWDELGAALADDFVLGQRLRPVRIGRAILATEAEAASWGSALCHYFRWSKTIRWNRPFGTAARLIVLPVLGWIVLVLAHPLHWTGWLGLLGMMQVDSVFALLICRRVGCEVGWWQLAAVELWSVGRVVVWLISWLPGAVRWRGQVWPGPRHAGPSLPTGSNRLD